MNLWMGVLLALATAAKEPYNGPNGLDPSALKVFASANNPLEFDSENSGKFLDWLYADENVEQRAEAVAYFVRCAFGPDMHFRIAPWPEWRGKYGLATESIARIEGLVASIKAGKAPSRVRTDLSLSADDGKWVSSCLVALVNQKGLHQVVALRGNHPALTKELLDATRWTLGYPEGVFFADLLNFSDSPAPAPSPVPPAPHPALPPPPTPPAAMAPPQASGKAAGPFHRDPTLEERERSFTIALNVPECRPPLPAALKPPPNVPLGRTLDWREWTCEPSDVNCEYRLARRLGIGEPAGQPAPLDPDHAASEICVTRDDPMVVNPCPPKASPDPVHRLRPLFVHLPRFIRIADVKVPDTGGVVNASLSGTLDPAQIRACTPDDCVAPFTHLWAGGTPPCAPPPGNPGLFTGLRDDQTITATLRLLDTAPERPGLKIDAGQKFTALIRYRSKGASRARVLIPKAGSGPETWPTIETALRPGPEFQWLQVYPVQPFVEKSKRMSLRVQLQGVPGGKGFPELDVVGFVPDRPWCVVDEPKNDGPIAVVCP